MLFNTQRRPIYETFERLTGIYTACAHLFHNMISRTQDIKKGFKHDLFFQLYLMLDITAVHMLLRLSAAVGKQPANSQCAMCFLV